MIFNINSTRGHTGSLLVIIMRPKTAGAMWRGNCFKRYYLSTIDDSRVCSEKIVSFLWLFTQL